MFVCVEEAFSGRLHVCSRLADKHACCVYCIIYCTLFSSHYYIIISLLLSSLASLYIYCQLSGHPYTCNTANHIIPGTEFYQPVPFPRSVYIHTPVMTLAVHTGQWRLICGANRPTTHPSTLSRHTSRQGQNVLPNYAYWCVFMCLLVSMCAGGVYVCWWCLCALVVSMCAGGVYVRWWCLYVLVCVYVCWWCLCVLVVSVCAGGVCVCWCVSMCAGGVYVCWWCLCALVVSMCTGVCLCVLVVSVS